MWAAFELDNVVWWGWHESCLSCDGFPRIHFAFQMNDGWITCLPFNWMNHDGWKFRIVGPNYIIWRPRIFYWKHGSNFYFYFFDSRFMSVGKCDGTCHLNLTIFLWWMMHSKFFWLLNEWMNDWAKLEFIGVRKFTSHEE